MPTYSVSVKRSAAIALGTIPTRYCRRIVQAIDALAEEPRPDGCKKLKGTPDLYRIRVGDYRVVYEVRDVELVVLIVRLGDRKDIYR